MGISFASKVTVPEDVLFRDLEGESVLLNLESENYFGLDDVGTRIWFLLLSSDSIQTAFDTLLAEYDVDEETLRRDLGELLEELVSQGLAVITEVSDG